MNMRHWGIIGLSGIGITMLVTSVINFNMMNIVGHDTFRLIIGALIAFTVMDKVEKERILRKASTV